MEDLSHILCMTYTHFAKMQKKLFGFYYVTYVFNNVIQVALNLLVYQAREPSLVPAAFLTRVSAENIVYEVFVVMGN